MEFCGELSKMDESTVNKKIVENGFQTISNEIVEESKNQRLEWALQRNGERPAFDPKNPRKGRPPGKHPPLCKTEQDYRKRMYQRERRRKERLAKICAQQTLPSQPNTLPSGQLQPAVQFRPAGQPQLAEPTGTMSPESIDLDSIVPTLQAKHLPCSEVLKSVVILDFDDIDRDEFNFNLG